MMKSMMFLLFLLTLPVICGCQASEPPKSTPAQPTSTPAQTPKKSASFKLDVAKGPTKPVEIWLEGPTEEKRTVEPSELSQSFELAEGVYDLTVRSEGYRNFALKIQIPEMDGLKAVLTPLPKKADAPDTPIDDPFER
jgi:hypothetical protein